MNLSNIHSCFAQIQTAVRSLFLRCDPSCIRPRCQVHPETFNPDDLEFVQLGSQRIIRVLHLSQKSINPFTQSYIIESHQELNFQNETTSRNFVVPTEEYWFARSNRPSRMGDACDCISHTYTSSRQFAESSRKYMADRCNEVIKNLSEDRRLKIFSSERIDDLIEKFADNFAKMVLREVFFHAMNKFKPIVSAQGNFHLQNSVLNTESVHESTTSNSLVTTHNLQNLNQALYETKVEVHHSHNDKPINMRHSEEYKADMKKEYLLETSYSIYEDGIVNRSFEGTFNEPDAITSGGYDGGKLIEDVAVIPEFLSCNLENLSAVKETRECSDNVGDGDLESQQNEEKFLFRKNGIKNSKAGDFNECVYEVSNVDKANGSFQKEIPFNVMKNDCECSVENENLPDNLSSCFTNSRDEKANVKTKVSPDCCRHTKNTQKPLLLFLHGAGSSADVWSVLLEYFASVGYEVLAPDMLGHGYSSAPDNRGAYTFDKLLQDVLQIFDRFVSDNKKCIVIGHSYGSCFAAALARYRPQQVAQLVLLSSGGPSPLVPKQAFFSLPSCVMSFMKPFLMCGFKRDLFYAPRGKHLPPSCTYELPPYVLKHMECGQEWSDGDSAFHRRILVPTLLVHGLKDPYITLVEECEMERTIPRSFLEVISNAGHMLMLDTPEQLCHMIHSFITWWNS